MQAARSAIGLAANYFRPGKSTSSVEDEAPDHCSLPWRPGEGRIPAGWNGTQMRELRPWSERFPCIGRSCAAEDRWHAAGSLCVLYKDCSMDGKVGQWQKLCAECAAQPETQCWPRRTSLCEPATSAGASSGRSAAATSASKDDWENDHWGAEDEAELQRLGCSPKADDALRPACATAAAPNRAPAPSASAAVELCLRCAKVGPCDCFMSHDSERELAQELWAEAKSRMPRVQHDGRLAMPGGGKAIDFKQLRIDFPSLPYIRAAPAETRANKLLAKEGGKWTPALQIQARQFFECEAGGVQLVMFVPEVYAREVLLEDPKYQVKAPTGELLGCKLCCPGCQSNDFVLLHGLNVHAGSAAWRFGYGNGCATSPVSARYVCCSPACPDVKDKALKTKGPALHLKMLKHFTQDGLLGASAKGKVTELLGLGV